MLWYCSITFELIKEKAAFPFESRATLLESLFNLTSANIMQIDVTDLLWVSIPTLPPCYKATRNGLLAKFTPDESFKLIKLHTQRQNKRGYPKKPYLFIAWKRNHRYRQLYVHRLIALTFIPNPNNLLEVNHKDGNKFNNSVENLEWVSHKRNSVHASESGLYAHGEKQYNSKISNDHVFAIRQLHSLGWSQGKLSKIFPIGQTTIGQITRRKTWKHL